MYLEHRFSFCVDGRQERQGWCAGLGGAEAERRPAWGTVSSRCSWPVGRNRWLSATGFVLRSGVAVLEVLAAGSAWCREAFVRQGGEGLLASRAAFDNKDIEASELLT